MPTRPSCRSTRRGRRVRTAADGRPGARRQVSTKRARAFQRGRVAWRSSTTAPTLHRAAPRRRRRGGDRLPAPRRPGSSPATTAMLSNGPGDPEPLTLETEVVRGLLGRVPVLGICLGHQLLGLATGHETYKLLPSAIAAPTIPVLERRTRRRHEPEPRLRGGAERRGRGDARLALRRHGRGLRPARCPRHRCSSTPRQAPVHPRRVADPRGLGRGNRRCPLGETSSR